MIKHSRTQAYMHLLAYIMQLYKHIHTERQTDNRQLSNRQTDTNLAHGYTHNYARKITFSFHRWDYFNLRPEVNRILET